MKILAIQPFLQGYTISPFVGGKNKTALRLAQYLVAQGHEIFVLPWFERLFDETPFRLGNGGTYAIALPSVIPPSLGKLVRALPSLIGSSQLPLHPAKRISAWAHQLMFDRTTPLMEAMERIQPDLVHVHSPGLDFPLVYRKLGYTRPLILTHTHDVNPYLDHYDQIIFHSMYQRDRTSHADPSLKVLSRVIYCPVDYDYHRQDIAHGNGEIVFMGVLQDERKGLDILLKAYIADPVLNQWRLTIIGEGAMRTSYERMIDGRSLNVRFVGRVSNEDSAKLMAAANLFVLSSREEGFGIVYAEALCMGLPVIGYPSSIREISMLLGKPVGLPFDATANDHMQLANLIKQMMSPKSSFDESVRQDLAQRARRFFSFEKFGCEHVLCYEEAIASNKVPTASRKIPSV